MTHQRTLTAAHWGVYEVEYDENGKAAKLHPFSKDPDPSPIGLHMLSDEVARLRVLPPVDPQELAEHGPGAASDGRGGDPYVAVSWDEAAVQLVASELTRVRAEHVRPRARSSAAPTAGRAPGASTTRRRSSTAFSPRSRAAT